MSTEHDFKVGSPQWNYLVSDLQKVNRTLTPWVIFTGHKPMYSRSGGSFAEGMRSELEDVLLVSFLIGFGFYFFHSSHPLSLPPSLPLSLSIRSLMSILPGGGMFMFTNEPVLFISSIALMNLIRITRLEIQVNYLFLLEKANQYLTINI